MQEPASRSTIRSTETSVAAVEEEEDCGPIPVGKLEVRIYALCLSFLCQNGTF